MPITEVLTSGLPDLPIPPTQASIAEQARRDSVGQITKIISIDLASEVQGLLPNANLANMAALTMKGNKTSASAAPQDLVMTDVIAMLVAAGFSGGGGGYTAPRVQTITGATGSQILDLTSYDAVIMKLTGNVNVTFTGGVEFQTYRLRFVQPILGGCTVTFGVGVGYGTDLPLYTANTASLKTDNVGIIRNLDAGRYEVVSYSRGY
jgi:hypothetical protein